MEKYESKQVQIRRPAHFVYMSLSDFSRFTPILADKVSGWEATEDTCSFTVQGIPMKLRIVEREIDRMIKIEGDEGSPMEFTLWFQFVEAGADDTRMRIVLHAKLNMMMKMMIGKKLQSGIDQIAEKIAEAFNNAPI